MRRQEIGGRPATTTLTLQALVNLEHNGYKFVQVNGLTLDMHYDYVEPHWIILKPLKELPTAQIDKGIYEPLDSSLLREWATNTSDTIQVLIATNN